MKDSYQDIIEIYKTEFPEIDCRIRFVDLERGQVHSLFFDYNSTIWDTLKYKTIKKINVLHEEQMKTYDQLVVKLKSQI